MTARIVDTIISNKAVFEALHNSNYSVEIPADKSYQKISWNVVWQGLSVRS